MANSGPLTRNLATGQNGILTSSDILTDLSGNVVVPPVPKIVSTTSSINLLATGTTNLYTVPAGKTFVPYGAVIRPTTATSISADAVAGIGVAAGEDDIISSQTLTNMRSTSSSYYLGIPSGLSARVSAGSIIKLGVDTAATGTTLTVDIDLLGYFQGETTGQGGGTAVQGPYSCQVYKSASQSLTNGGYTLITYDSELYDNGNMHNNVTNNSRITFPVDGLYFVSAYSIVSTAAVWQVSDISLYNSSGVAQGQNSIQSTVGGSGLSQYIVNSSTFRAAATDYVVHNMNIVTNGTSITVGVFRAALIAGQY